MKKDMINWVEKNKTKILELYKKQFLKLYILPWYNFLITFLKCDRLLNQKNYIIKFIDPISD